MLSTRLVFDHQFIGQGSVEERIHPLQAMKNQLADSLLSAAAADESTLSALLAPLG